MSQPTLTPDRLRELLTYDPATGTFRWKVRRSRGALAGAVAGQLNAGYRYIRIDQRAYAAHRLAFLYMTSAWPGPQVDHINGAKDDNRWCNLRSAHAGLNNQNRRGPTSLSTSGYLGVCIDRTALRNGHKPYLATIGVAGRSHRLGHYATPEEAHAAYLGAKRRLHEFGTI